MLKRLIAAVIDASLHVGIYEEVDSNAMNGERSTELRMDGSRPSVASSLAIARARSPVA